MPTGFVVFSPSADIKFYDDGVQLTYVDPPGSSTQFKFSGTLIDGGYQGGTLVLGGIATSGSVMAAVRDIPIERTTDFSYPSSTLDLEGLNTQLDKLFAIFQDRETNQNRAVRQPVSDTLNIDYMPGSTARAGKYLAFNSSGDPIASAAATSTGAPISAYAATFLDDADEAAFKATVNLESGVDFQAYSALLLDLANITPSTGDLLMGASSTGWVVIPKGTTGYFLTPTSTGLAYVAAVAGLTLISAQNPSGVASVDFTTGLDSTYDEYVLVGRLVPATDDVELWLRTDSNGGASFDATANDYANGFRAVCPTATESTLNTSAEIKIVGAAAGANAISNAAEAGANFWAQFSLGSTSQFPIFNIKSSWGIAADTRHGSQQGGGARLSAATINSVQILAESGNISGHVALYGLKKS